MRRTAEAKMEHMSMATTCTASRQAGVAPASQYAVSSAQDTASRPAWRALVIACGQVLGEAGEQHVPSLLACRPGGVRQQALTLACGLVAVLLQRPVTGISARWGELELGGPF